LTALHLFIPLMIMISSELCLNEYQWISKLLVKFAYGVPSWNILILNILFFNKLRQIIPEIRSERQDLLIFIFILKMTDTFTPVHSSPILVTGSVNGSQNVYCVSDYCQRLRHMYSGIRSESCRPNVKWHLYIIFWH
jgi:hypothetical protein